MIIDTSENKVFLISFDYNLTFFVLIYIVLDYFIFSSLFC